MPETIPHCASSYDEIAGMYHALWADWYLPAAMPALERLFFARVPKHARVLDLCCGSGHVTKELVARGYDVTGIDNSAELITIARRELPGIDLRVQDARYLDFNCHFDAVLSTFDSLNHLLSLEDLRLVFNGVRRTLKNDGLFFFDMNLAEAYSADLHQWAVDLSDDNVSMVRGTYYPGSGKARTELIWFVRCGPGNSWQRRQTVVEQQCYSLEQILLTLSESGFRKVETIPAKDAEVTSELGFGRVYFVAQP
ncbi:MAG: class I SAM-dependent methyltransferase [Acidobacteriaceae bacterium]|nr:class I SAM-dependent methyltransferase [Acidobacteriaceae bacterium]